MKIGIVTDSTADIPPEFQTELGIEVIPAILNIGQNSYTDGEGISRQEFYERLPGFKILPTTSAPSVGSFQERYEKLLSSGVDKILSIHPPLNLSGILNSARLAADSFVNKIKLIDSGQVSLGLGFQVLAVAEDSTRGAGLEELIKKIESIKRRVRLMALLDTLEYLRRSGRVSWAGAKVGEFLNIKPMVELRHGLVQRIGQVRTRAQGAQRLFENLIGWGPLERLAILHTNAESRAKDFLQKIHQEVHNPVMIVNVTSVIGTHVGPDGLGFVAIPCP